MRSLDLASRRDCVRDEGHVTRDFVRVMEECQRKYFRDAEERLKNDRNHDD